VYFYTLITRRQCAKYTKLNPGNIKFGTIVDTRKTILQTQTIYQTMFLNDIYIAIYNIFVIINTI